MNAIFHHQYPEVHQVCGRGKLNFRICVGSRKMTVGRWVQLTSTTNKYTWLTDWLTHRLVGLQQHGNQNFFYVLKFQSVIAQYRMTQRNLKTKFVNQKGIWKGGGPAGRPSSVGQRFSLTPYKTVSPALSGTSNTWTDLTRFFRSPMNTCSTLVRLDYATFQIASWLFKSCTTPQYTKHSLCIAMTGLSRNELRRCCSRRHLGGVFGTITIATYAAGAAAVTRRSLRNDHDRYKCCWSCCCHWYIYRLVFNPHNQSFDAASS